MATEKAEIGRIGTITRNPNGYWEVRDWVFGVFSGIGINAADPDIICGWHIDELRAMAERNRDHEKIGG